MQTVIPQFRIRSAQSSLSFYVDGLGFAVDWKHQFGQGYPLFLQITRLGQSLFLTEHVGDCEFGGAAYFIIPDAKACHSEFLSRGVSSITDPTDTAWGTCEFQVTDPDGNRLRFASKNQ